MARDSEFGYSFIEEFKDSVFYGTYICAVENLDSEFLNLSSYLDNAAED